MTLAIPETAQTSAQDTVLIEEPEIVSKSALHFKKGRILQDSSSESELEPEHLIIQDPFAEQENADVVAEPLNQVDADDDPIDVDSDGNEFEAYVRPVPVT